ncbi:MAG: TetR/AcrR family transcriptional regulator [Deferribacterales bacterium]
MNLRKRKEVLDNLFRERIVGTVIELIRESGGITMEEVARRSGVSKGSLYNYFENKELLMEYVHAEMMQPITKGIDGIFRSGKRPSEMLLDLFEGMFDVSDEVCLYFRFLDSHRTVEEDTKETHYLLLEPLSKIFEAGIKEGEFVDVDPYILANTFAGMVVGTFGSYGFRDADEADFLKAKEEMLKLIKKLIIT